MKREFSETGKIYSVRLLVVDTNNEKDIITVGLEQDCDMEDDAIYQAIELAVNRGLIDTYDDFIDMIRVHRYNEVIASISEREIGQAFQLDENKVSVIVMEEENIHQCKSCYFLSTECGFIRQPEDIIGPCKANYRKDGKNVYFKKV